MILAVIHAHILIKTVGDIKYAAQHSSVIFHSESSPCKRRKLRACTGHNFLYPLLIIHMHEIDMNTHISVFPDFRRHVAAVQMDGCLIC